MRANVRVRWRALLVVASLACLTLLAACGGSATAGGTPTQTPASASNGCPSQLIPVDSPRPPDVVLTQQSDPGSNVKTVTVTKGQVIEIRLPASFTWHLSQGEPSSVLEVAAPAGWYNSALRACIWRFDAASSGTAQLDFAGGPVCDPGKACPAIAVIAQYKITVS
jgi:hypothetical protein